MKTAHDDVIIGPDMMPAPYAAAKNEEEALVEIKPIRSGCAQRNDGYPTANLVLRAEREADRAKIEEMRAALEPFANFIEAVDPDGDLDGEIGSVVVGALRHSISYAACRNAARVLTSNAPADSIRAAVFEEIAAIAEALARDAGIKSDLAAALRSKISDR